MWIQYFFEVRPQLSHTVLFYKLVDLSNILYPVIDRTHESLAYIFNLEEVHY